MGELDQFAKATFALHTEDITSGAVVWAGPQEVGLTEVRLDGLLIVRAPNRVGHLPAPWPDASRHVDVVVEVKMPGDHLDPMALRRADLRRAAWHVKRIAKEGRAWEGSVGLWLVAPHVPEVLSRLEPMHEVAQGCYAVGGPLARFWWMAANELPLHDALLPFLVARSGKALREFVEWAAKRKPVDWVVSMLRLMPMDPQARWELLKQTHQEYSANIPPSMLEQDLWLGREFLKAHPDLVEEVTRGATQAAAQTATLNEARRSLRRVLAVRALPLTPGQNERIDACADLATLERWHDRAVTAASAADALD